MILSFSNSYLKISTFTFVHILNIILVKKRVGEYFGKLHIISRRWEYISSIQIFKQTKSWKSQFEVPFLNIWKRYPKTNPTSILLEPGFRFRDKSIWWRKPKIFFCSILKRTNVYPWIKLCIKVLLLQVMPTLFTEVKVYLLWYKSKVWNRFLRKRVCHQNN